MMMIIIIQHVELITIKKINATKKFAGAIIVIPKRQLLAQKTHMMHGLLQSVHLFCAELTFYPNAKSYALQCFLISQTSTKVPSPWRHLHPQAIHVPWT